MAAAQPMTESDQMEVAMAYAARRLIVPSLNIHQKQAVRAFMDGKDVFVSLHTGFGKLLCFRSLPFVNDYLDSSPESCIIEDR